MLRPSALTMPAVTVCSKPSGLPIAIAISPRRSSAEWPSSSGVSEPRDMPSMHSTARSVSGSSPTQRASNSRPSLSDAAYRLAFGGGRWAPARTTCELVSKKPSGVNKKPDPLPSGASRSVAPPSTRTEATLGPARSTTSLTVCE